MEIGDYIVQIVDDEEPVRKSLAFLLTKAGFAVRVHDSATAFLASAPSIRSGVLVTDLRMPGVDGLTVIREARRLKAELPVIIITGYSSEASAIEAINLGVQGYLTKPFRVPRVLATASKALGETTN